jgi:hypothetical protein
MRLGEKHMKKGILIFISAAAVCGALLVAQEAKVTIPVGLTPADDGKSMFVSYCAPCHGLDGRGHGPTSTALKTQPSDLTQLSKDNHGSFPGTHVVAVLKFGVQNDPSHGSKAMPVWGPALQKLDNPGSGNQDFEALRINNLVKYVETLQIK